MVEEAPDHLGRDPLPGVLGADVDGGRAPARAGPRRVLGDPHRVDVLAVHGLADDLELGDGGIRRRLGDELLLDATRPAVAAEHAVGEGGHLPLGAGLGRQRGAGGVEGLGLPVAQDHLDRELVGDSADRRHLQLVAVDAELEQLLEAGAVDGARIHGEAPALERIRRHGFGTDAGAGPRQPGQKHRAGECERETTTNHAATPRRHEAIMLRRRRHRVNGTAVPR